VRIRATTWDDKKDEDFIDRIKSVLAMPLVPDTLNNLKPKLQVFSTCHGIIADIENVQWVKYRNLDEFKPKLDISNKDYLSCLKYALASNLRYGKDSSKIYRWNRPISSYGITVNKSKKYYRKLLKVKRRGR